MIPAYPLESHAHFKAIKKERTMTIEDVMTTGEAAERWDLSVETVKKACQGQKGNPPRFQEGEYRKSGRAWLVTRQGMERLYGPEKGIG